MGKKNKNNKKYKGYHPELAGGVVSTDHGEIKCSAIYNYLISLTEEDIVNYVNDRVEHGHHYPSIEQITKGFIMQKYFPQLMAPLNSPFIQEQMEAIDTKLVPGLIYRMQVEGKDGAPGPKNYVASYTTAIPIYIADCKLIRDRDDNLYHVCDYRMIKDEFTQSLFESIINGDEFVKEFGDVIAKGLLRLISRYDKGDIDHDDYVRIADWYLKDLKLEGSFDGALYFMDTMSDLSKIESFQEIALEFYEEHSSSMDRMMKRFPQYDYVNRGKCDVYASISDYVKKNGGKEEDFFIEEADGEANSASRAGKRAANKVKRAEYRLKVIEAMDILFKEVQKVSSEFRVLNFTPNELKTKKAHSDYIAIAFKRGEEWSILVDSIKPGNAVYIWSGEKYSLGLEIFKMAKTYARQEPGVRRKNHVQTKEFAEIYKSLAL